MSLKVDDDSSEKMGDGMRIRERERGSQISRDLRCLCNEYDEGREGGRRDGAEEGIIKRSGDGTYCPGYYAILFLSTTVILRASGARVGMLV